MIRADPHIGLLHRATEKLIEYKTYLQVTMCSNSFKCVKVLFILLYKMVFAMKSVDNTLVCDHSNERY